MVDTQAQLPYRSIGEELSKTFGGKIVKLSLDAGFTCPNRDGTRGSGGCLFCSAGGSGELASDIPGQIELLRDKWPGAAGYIAYFQSHTNTYAPVSRLRALWEEALSHPGVVGLAVATRPDCLSPEVLDLLEEFSRRSYLWVELGLQTVHDATAFTQNRCYETREYWAAAEELDRRGIRLVTHLILGLPGESRAMMEESVRAVCCRKDGRVPLFGLKFHLLNVVRGSGLADAFPGYVPFESPEAYIRLVADLLALVPPEVTIHRLTGDVPRRLLLAPSWSYQKRTILNGILKLMRQEGIKQGCRETLQPDDTI